ncbi:MAG TPA: YdeI/OmpD-associated family protein [Gemmatimonadaceae bacterium]
MASLDEPLFFATPADFRAWLEANHAAESELWVGFHRRSTGRPSITWQESVVEALRVGWIDGLRRTRDEHSYVIRFTPRKPTSTWSAINIATMERLLAEGRVNEAGRAAYERRKTAKSGVYSYENRKLAKLDRASEREFRANAKAWRWFEAAPAGYRKTAIWLVISAKKPETRARRLAQLIAHSARGERIPALTPRRAAPKRGAKRSTDQ